MSTKLTSILLILAALILFVIAGEPFFILYEGKQAVITQFGMPIGSPIVEAGFYLKIPFIQKVNYFEKRILEWDGYANQIPTKDKKYILVDTTARWRISDPLRFFQSVNDERGAQARLDDILDSAARDAVTGHNLIELVRSSNRIIAELEQSHQEEKEFIEEGALEEVKFGRDKMRQDIIRTAKQLAPEYGIEIIDVRIKRVNYIEDVRKKVYDRMIAERKRAAESYRSEGRGISAEIEGKTDKELKGILSEAYKDAQTIKGEADAKAAEIFASAYNNDPELFSFIKTLETYKEAFDEDTVLMLTTDSEYLKYFKHIFPQK